MNTPPPSSPSPRLGHPLVRCTLAALAMTVGLGVGGCGGKKPSEAQCQEFTDHYIALLKEGDDEGHKIRKLSEKRRDRVLELCVIEGTEAEVLCALEQDSFEAIAANCK